MRVGAAEADPIVVKCGDFRPVFQGDLMLVRHRGAVPEGCTPVADGVLAHSETGHHHVALRARVSQQDVMNLWAQAIGRVRCGTGRDFCLPVPPECATALAANAWLYGVEDLAWFRDYAGRT